MKARRPIPQTRRRWLFRLAAAVGVPAALLMLAETGLRVAGYGYPTSAFVRQEIQGRTCYVSNPAFAWRYLSPAIPLEFEPIVFAAEKPPNTRRIFILGASAAQGTPEPAYAFGRLLDVMLRESCPETDFEVLIPAMPAINSHAVMDVARDCARHQPDLMIAYLGNNEVVGPYGAGTVFAPLLNQRWLIRSSLAVKRLRTGQLIEAVLSRHLKGKQPRPWRGLEMFVGREVAGDDQRLETVYAHFRRNVQEICRTAESRGIPLLLCTVAVNLRDCAPFASRHRADLSAEAMRQWNACFQQALEAEQAGHHAEARDAYRQAVALAPEHAEAQFRLARCLARLGDPAAAGQHYRQALERDVLRLRADAAINRIIREVAESADPRTVSLVDIEEHLAERSPHHQTGKEFFHEHVHFTFSGNCEVARRLTAAARERLRRDTPPANTPPAVAMDEATCARRLAYTGWDQYDIARRLRFEYFSKPPFTGQADHAARLAECDATLAALKVHVTPEGLAQAEQAYLEALRGRPEDLQLHWRYGLLLEARQQPAQAEAQYRWVADHSGNFSRVMLQWARLCGDRGRLQEAQRLIQQALRCQPCQPYAFYNLGFIYQKQQQPNAAIQAWRRAVELKPDFGAAYNNLGGALYLSGQTDAAIAALRQGLAEEPDLYDLHYNLGAILLARGETEAGRQSVQRALEINPQAVMARRLLDALGP